jgi:hypothetical protein
MRRDVDERIRGGAEWGKFDTPKVWDTLHTLETPLDDWTAPVTGCQAVSPQ